MVNLRHLTLAPLALLVALSGCSGHRIPEKTDIPSKSALTDKMRAQWATETPAIRTIGLDQSFTIESPQAIPKAIADKKIEVMFSKDSTLDDLGAVLSDIGFYLVVPDEALRTKKIVIFNYKGSFGDFLNAISIAHGLSFSWLPGNVLMVTESKPYILQIPQNESVAKAIDENITALGAKDVKTSVQAGTIQYTANQQNQQRIAKMIEKMGVNASLVSMQVAVLNTAIDRELNQGFDWSSLKAGIGALGLANVDPSTTSTSGTGSGTNGSNSTLGTGTGTGTGTTDGTDTTTTIKGRTSGLYMGLGKDGLAVNVSTGNFNFLSAFNLLSTYGETKTTQSVSMDTISGEEVAIKSGQKVPYIDSVGVNSSNGYNNNNSGSNSNGNINSLGSTSVKEVDIGLELKLKPYFDDRSKLVSINVDLKLSSLLRFVELSAGNQIGTLSRPQTQEQSFTDNVKVRAGESLIIGGLMYDQLTDNRSNLAVLDDYDTASKSKKISRTAMFILIRPTVTVFSAKGAVHE
jgi:type II secretory pathway component GspD/PulD (secretin)